MRVTSGAMDYNDLKREGTFTGGVRVDGATGQARSHTAVVLLKAADPAESNAGGATIAGNPLGGSLDKIVLSGDVRLDQPGRIGTGEQLVYTAADASFILTGTAARPPHVVDAQQGSVTGATLLFQQGESTIVVAGAPAAGNSKHGRVRTETEVRQ